MNYLFKYLSFILLLLPITLFSLIQINSHKWYQSAVPTMDTCGKSNAEFHNDVNEILAQHESNFDQVNATLQRVLTELKALRTSSPSPSHPEMNPFEREESSHPHNSHSNTTNGHPHQYLKLSFPKFNGDIRLARSTRLNNILISQVLRRTNEFS